MRWLCLLAALFSVPIYSRAEAPELKAIHPIGAGQGTTNTYTLSGKFDPWPPKFWSEPPDLIFKPETNKNKVTIEIPKFTKPGPHLIRVYNDNGSSDPKFFVVDGSDQQDEKEPNNHLAEAQEAKIPSTFNGRLDKSDDVDCYKITLKSGEWLDASIEAYTLMSKIDAVLKLVTTNGVTLTWNHDYETFDPHLWWRAPEDQTVILQVFGFTYPANSDIRLAGCDECFYRLHLASTTPPEWHDAQPKSKTLPLQSAGTISKAGQQDRFEFIGKKNQFVEASIEAASLGSPLDAWLQITDATGKELARQDDSGGLPDPRLEWKCPADTNYFVVVGSTLNRGATNYHYKLTVLPGLPDFSATWSANSLLLNAGATNTIKIDFKRLHEDTNDITAEFQNLPPGIDFSPTNLPAKSGEVSFTLTAATNAAPFQGPIRLALTDSQKNLRHFALVELTTRGENNGVPNGYSKLAIDSLDSIWLTVKLPATNIAANNTAAK